MKGSKITSCDGIVFINLKFRGEMVKNFLSIFLELHVPKGRNEMRGEILHAVRNQMGILKIHERKNLEF